MARALIGQLQEDGTVRAMMRAENAWLDKLGLELVEIHENRHSAGRFLYTGDEWRPSSASQRPAAREDSARAFLTVEEYAETAWRWEAHYAYLQAPGGGWLVQARHGLGPKSEQGWLPLRSVLSDLGRLSRELRDGFWPDTELRATALNPIILEMF